MPTLGLARPAEAATSPYHAAREEHDRRFGKMADEIRYLRGVLLVSLLATGAATWRAMEVAGQARVVPYVVEVDRLGQMTAFGELTPFREPEYRHVTSELVRLIGDLRTVSVDPTIQAEMAGRGYAHTRGDARKFVDGYFADPDLNPWGIAESSVRQVDVTRVRNRPGTNTWVVEWQERDIPIRGGSARVSNWVADLVVEVVPPRSREELRANFTGIYATQLGWQRTTEPVEVRAQDVQRDLRAAGARRERGLSVPPPVPVPSDSRGSPPAP